MRQLAASRKPIISGIPKSADGSGDDGDGQDVETCPNCACEFTDADEGGKPTVIKPGKPVVGANQGAELDTLDSAEPVPGKFGTARDGAMGTNAMAHLLGALGGGQ